MTPVTSSSLVPTSTSNESHTRSVELRARSRSAVQRVSHSCRRASRSFQIRNSRSRSTSFALVPDSQLTIAIDRGRATTVLSEHHNKEQRKRTQRRSATMFAVFLETRRPTSDVEVATPFVRDFNPSLALHFSTTIASKGSMIPSGSTIVHLPHFQQFRHFC